MAAPGRVRGNVVADGDASTGPQQVRKELRIRSRMFSVTPLAVTIVMAPTAATAAPFLHYMGKPVSLTGNVESRTSFGPPNYGENPDTDSRETQAILIMRKP